MLDLGTVDINSPLLMLAKLIISVWDFQRLKEEIEVVVTFVKEREGLSILVEP
jgi:hypothetical protein